MKNRALFAVAVSLIVVVLISISGLDPSNTISVLGQDIGTRVFPLVQGMDVDRFNAVGEVPGCTATLISDRVVLTAAHCVCNANRCDTRGVFWLADVPLHTGGEGTRSFNGDVFVYPKTVKRGNIFQLDAALLVLDRPATSDVIVRPWPIASPNSAANRPVLLVGYGNTGASCNEPGAKLFAPSVITGISDVEISVAQRGVQLCPGDSGGPLVSDAGTILGVNSWRRHDADGVTLLSVVARIDTPSMYRWIACIITNRCLSSVGDWRIETYFDGGDSIAAGDVDGDRIPEILEAEDYDGIIRVYDPRMSYQGLIKTSYDRGGDRIAVGDINGDGLGEILVAEDDGGMIDVHNYPEGQRIYTQQPGRECHTTFDGGDGLAAADVDGDGRAEVIMAEDDGGPVGIYRAIIRSQQVCYQLIRGLRTSYDGGDTLVAGDIDGDGQAEIIVLEDDGGHAEVYTANGAHLGYLATTYDSGDSAAMANVVPSIGAMEILVAEDYDGLVTSYGP